MATLPMTQDMEGVEDTRLERSFSALESNCENTVDKKNKIKKLKREKKNRGRIHEAKYIMLANFNVSYLKVLWRPHLGCEAEIALFRQRLL